MRYICEENQLGMSRFFQLMRKLDKLIPLFFEFVTLFFKNIPLLFEFIALLLYLFLLFGQLFIQAILGTEGFIDYQQQSRY